MRQDGVAVFVSLKIGCSPARTLQVLRDRQQRGNERCRHPTAWMLCDERVWRGSHLRPKLTIGKDIYIVISVYTHQFGRTDAKKDNFYDKLRPVVAEIPTSWILILLDDGNGHAGISSAGFRVHGGHNWGTRRARGWEITGVCRVLQPGDR